MFHNVYQKEHVIIKRTLENLRIITALADHKVMLFYDQGLFCLYSLSTMTVLREGRLPSCPYEVIAISPSRLVLSLFDCQTLLLLDEETQSITQLCKMPLGVSAYIMNEADVFFETHIHGFKNQNAFYMRYLHNDERRLVFHYFKVHETTKDSVYTMQKHMIDSKKLVDQKIDQDSCIAVYNQCIDERGLFRFKIMDFSNNFTGQEIKVQSDAFDLLSIVRLIKKVSKNTYAVFVNGKKSQCLIVSQREVISTFVNTNILNFGLLLNLQQQYGVLSYLSIGKKHKVELMSLVDGRKMETRELMCQDISGSPEEDYFVNYKRERATKTTTFSVYHVLGKPVSYLHLLEGIGVLNHYPGLLIEQTLAMLQ